MFSSEHELIENKRDFQKMLDTEKLDVLVVTTIDATHDEYIIPALHAGVRVLTEKPMTTYVSFDLPRVLKGGKLIK